MSVNVEGFRAFLERCLLPRSETRTSRAMRFNRKQVAAWLGATLLAVTISSPSRAEAAPPSKQQCFASHAKSQELRLDSKLIEARGELRVCSDAACPPALQTDCANWMSEVQQGIPTVAFIATVDGKDTANVKISVDGNVLSEKVDDNAYEFNPGAHVFRFELKGEYPPEDYPPIEQTVVLRKDEKRRVINIQFEKPKPPEPATPPGGGPYSAQPAQPSPPLNGPRPVPLATYVFGGLALASAGVSGYFAYAGFKEKKNQEDTCAPNCSDEDVKKIKTDFVIADSLGGFAIVSAGLAAVFYFTRPVVIDEKPPSEESDKKPKESSWANHLRLTATPNTVGASLTGAF